MLEALAGLPGGRQDAASASTFLRDQLLTRGFAAATIKALQSALPVGEGIGKAVKESGTRLEFSKRKERVEATWKVGLRKPLVLPALRVLAGLARGGHGGTWSLLVKEGGLAMLHDIEGLTGSGDAGSVAEEMLEDALNAAAAGAGAGSGAAGTAGAGAGAGAGGAAAAAPPPGTANDTVDAACGTAAVATAASGLIEVGEAIKGLRQTTKSQKRRLAQQNRTRALSAMGLTVAPPPFPLPPSSPVVSPAVTTAAAAASLSQQQQPRQEDESVVSTEIEGSGGSAASASASASPSSFPSSSSASSPSPFPTTVLGTLSSNETPHSRRPRSLSLPALPSSFSFPSSFSSTAARRGGGGGGGGGAAAAAAATASSSSSSSKWLKDLQGLEEEAGVACE
eukprot:evm.model.NODE_3426_length_6769_cov_29.091299.1